MSLSAGTLGSLIDANLAGFGASGSNRTIFANKVAAGIVMSIVGKPFATSDTGLVPGVGAGSGTGITGLSSSAMSSVAVATLISTGANAQKLMDAIMNATVSHLGSATLTSTHSPVFLGTGTVTVGSIVVVIPEMASNIQTQLSGAGANGANLANLCLAIATGVCTGILSSGTGTVTITGTFTGSTPPGPLPGSGSGVGVIS